MQSGAFVILTKRFVILSEAKDLMPCSGDEVLRFAQDD